MRALETIVVIYAAGYGCWALVGRRASRSLRALLVSAAMVATIILVRHAPPAVRLLAPGLYLVAGYWLPALLVDGRAADRSLRFERWLIGSDALLRPRLRQVPPALVALTETAYLLCYPVVPLSLSLVWVKGGAAAVPRFWMTVLLAGFACYATLPWLVSRPPDRSGLRGLILRDINRFVLTRVSHQWTTFPSGHVAVSWSAALAVARVWTGAGVLLSLVALGVTIGAAAGRYHYVVDVLLGVIVAVIAVVIT